MCSKRVEWSNVYLIVNGGVIKYVIWVIQIDIHTEQILITLTKVFFLILFFSWKIKKLTKYNIGIYKCQNYIQSYTLVE